MGSFSKSIIAAKILDYVGKKRESAGFYKTVAQNMPFLRNVGKLLDIGTGTGYFLKVIHDLNSKIELYGLDVLPHAVYMARKNLKKSGIKPLIFQADILKTPFKDNFFDFVCCTNSLVYWEKPLKCLEEVRRILKLKGKAVFYEPYKEFNMRELEIGIETTLKNATSFRRFWVKKFHKIALRWGHRLGLKLYSYKEIENLLKKSVFKNSFKIEKASLIGVPIFVRIYLEKNY